MTGKLNPTPPFPPSINIDELKKFAKSLNSTILANDSRLCFKIKRNPTWALVYLWFCECARTNPKSQAKISVPELKKALPQLSTYQTYFFCHSMIYHGYFKRTEKEKWETDFQSKVNFVFLELIEAAEKKLKEVGIIEDEKLQPRQTLTTPA